MGNGRSVIRSWTASLRLGRDPAQNEPPHPARQHDVITIDSLRARQGWKRRLRGVSLHAGPGEVLGIAGPQKSGKTLLLRSMLGTVPVRSGSVRVFGRDPARDFVAVLSRIGYVSQTRDLVPGLRLCELMRFTQAFYPQWDEAYAQDLLAQFGLSPGAGIDLLNAGARTKAALLLALAHHPDLLVLDEPFDASCPDLDFLRTRIRSLAGEGRTVVVASRSFTEVERVADHVVMLDAGRVLLDTPMDTFRSTHHRCVVKLDSPWPVWPELPGLLSISGTGEAWELTFEGDPDAFVHAVTELDGHVVEVAPATLEAVYAGLILARNRARIASA